MAELPSAFMYPDHAFCELVDALAAANGVPASMVVAGHGIEAIAKAVTPRTKLIWVCNPNNPTGTILSRRETQAFLDALPSGVAVVFDQAYREFVDGPDYADGIAFLKEGYENVLVLRTFSTTPADRLAAIVASTP